MKKRQLLALGLLCGMVFPLSTQAYEDGIYTGLVDENGSGVITVIWSGVAMTLKAENQTGNYYWGFNENTDNSVFDDYTNPGTGKYMSGDGKMHGGTYGEIRNNLWGGGADTYENGFNPNPSEESKIARRGPCDTGYHVPSRGERNELVTARCNLTTGCTLAESYDQNKNSGSNKLIYINQSGMGTKFKQDFSISSSDNVFWSSSPYPDDADNSWYLYLYTYNVFPNKNTYRNNYYRVRCLRNSIVEPAPQTFTLSFTGSEGGNLSTGSIEAEEGSSISRDDEAGSVTISGTVVATGIADEGYVFSGWLTDCGATLTANCTFTGEFKPIPYTITYLGTGDDYVPSATGYTIKSDAITLSKPSKTGYTFTGRSGTKLASLTQTVEIPAGSTGDRTYEANWEANEYTITIDIDGNETILTGKYGDHISKPADPSKNGYKFIGWEPEFPATMPAKDMTIKAKWEKNGSSGGGGGSNKSSSDVISNDSEKSTEQKDGDTGMDSSAEPQNDNQNAQDSQQAEQASDKASEGQTYTQEFQEAYEFAKGKGITTMPTIQKADMDGKLTRIAMAKMLSQYAINVLGMAPDITQNNKFNDVTEKMDSDYDDGVTLAYQLGIMGQNMPNNKFRPNDEVTRGEFVTALSRMLYNTSDGEYRSTPKYYTHHMEKMVGEGIITNTDPNMKELRGYVMIMLMRSAK